MNKPLSLNTQLTKLRSVIKLLKGTLPQSVVVLESGHRDTSRISLLKDIIYSLRDIQYELRGLTGYKAKRKAQVNHYSINEIEELLSAEISSISYPTHPLYAVYRANIDQAKTELETVAYFINDRQAKHKLNDDLF